MAASPGPPHSPRALTVPRPLAGSLPRFTSSRPSSDHLARVHDVVGIERALDPAHQLDLDRRLVMGDLLAFEPPDAVLGADRAGEVAHDPMDDVVELLPTREIRLPVGTCGL